MLAALVAREAIAGGPHSLKVSVEFGRVGFSTMSLDGGRPANRTFRHPYVLAIP